MRSLSRSRRRCHARDVDWRLGHRAGIVAPAGGEIFYPVAAHVRCADTERSRIRPRGRARHSVRAVVRDFKQRRARSDDPTDTPGRRPALQPQTDLPYALPDLLEGLDRLAEDASPALREFAARGLPRNWQAFIGDDDSLLDAEMVRRSLPGCVRVRGAGHAIADLLRASQAK